MTLPDGTRLTALDDDSRLADVLELDTWAFPTEHAVPDLLGLANPIPWGRAWGIEHEGASGLVGMYGAYSLEAFPVPGAETRCAWLTWVGVHPGHRRRGLLRNMIAHHFAEVRARGEALSVLNAAEAGIYGRFGYGHAAPAMALTVPRGAALREVLGSAELAAEFASWDPEAHGELIAAVHRDAGREPRGIGRPGWATWETPELRAVQEEDPAAMRGGREPLRILVVRDAEGRAQGYARFRRSPDRSGGISDGAVEIRDLVGLSPAAVHRMWSLLLDLDLTSRATIEKIPVDDPILHLLVDPRAARPVVRDLVWVRILDLPAALAERRYAAPVDLVLEVTDALVAENAGRWRVVVDEAFGAARVTRADAAAAPDLSLDIEALGAAHLGAVSLAALAAAGRVEARDPRALAAAAVAWSWPVMAGANWEF
ncbi:GNAT family N-acetyltransferase [Leucobacter zeae]|nr:GNAT family N-acetyltransferase [Leucobacter zeae]